jgi:AcrR family transcriptional regulator
VIEPRRYHRLDPAERRGQILDAANGLFAERGYNEVSIEDVAKRAGVARGLVHHYFVSVVVARARGGAAGVKDRQP